MENYAISSDLIRGHIDTIILHTLLDGDKFAQQISDAIEQKSGGEYKINQATLYSSLKRLESLKYVNSFWHDSVNGRRKYFKLTESGKKTVENNLSSWTFSRGIIDKLIDCEPNVYKDKSTKEYVDSIEKNISVQKTIEVNKDTNAFPYQASSHNTQSENSSKNHEVTLDNNQDINFRHILNGLIKATTVKKDEYNELEPLKKSDLNDDSIEKLKLNETLNTTNYNSQKLNNNVKIDFGDLILKASKEGYKIRISSKDSAIAEGNILINKVNWFASLAMLFVMVLQFLFISLKYNHLFKIVPILMVLLPVIVLILPIIFSIKYFINPRKTTLSFNSADSILTSAIVIFNLFLITFAANLLCNVDFSNIFTILLSLIIPSILYLDIFIFFLVRHIFLKTKMCRIKK